MRRRTAAAALVLIVGSVSAGEGADMGRTAKESMTMQIISTAFSDGGEIAGKYTCEGEDVAPPLAWADLPDGAESLVLIVDDPDAPDPDAPQVVWVHWVLYNIPVSATGLPEAVGSSALPAGTLEGLNDWQRTGYGGPCPPIGRHRYFHKLYALDTTLAQLDSPTKANLEKAMEGHVIGRAQLVGTYQKRVQ